jgi:hypothetical protein
MPWSLIAKVGLICQIIWYPVIKLERRYNISISKDIF